MFTCEEQLEIAALRYQQISCLAAAVIISRRGRILKYKKRSVWVRKWILDRPLFGQYENLMSELCRTDIKGYRSFIRVVPAMFVVLTVTYWSVRGGYKAYISPRMLP